MQVEHKTEKGTVLFVEVPDDSSGFNLINLPLLSQLTIDNYNSWNRNFYSGNWQLIGLTSEVTEKQAKMMVEAKHNIRYADRNDLTGYRKYGELHKDGKPYWLSSALDSFKSLMQHKKLYEVNPLGPYEHAHKRHLVTGTWQEAQERTSKRVVLFKPNEK